MSRSLTLGDCMLERSPCSGLGTVLEGSWNRLRTGLDLLDLMWCSRGSSVMCIGEPASDPDPSCTSWIRPSDSTRRERAVGRSSLMGSESSISRIPTSESESVATGSSKTYWKGFWTGRPWRITHAGPPKLTVSPGSRQALQPDGSFMSFIQVPLVAPMSHRVIRPSSIENLACWRLMRRGSSSWSSTRVLFGVRPTVNSMPGWWLFRWSFKATVSTMPWPETGLAALCWTRRRSIVESHERSAVMRWSLPASRRTTSALTKGYSAPTSETQETLPRRREGSRALILEAASAVIWYSSCQRLTGGRSVGHRNLGV
mmetsp:Transcript_5185/g.14504  ORF Transcript_5185/g.14504 Transcript_5185/m.14504 type:complete len:315 (-) Transcript_5185:221-1165(-)